MLDQELFKELDLKHKEHELELLKCKINKAKLQTTHWEKELKKDNASAENAGRYTFYGVVDEKTTLSCILSLDQWSRMNPGQPLTFIINSPGGSALLGFAIFDFLQELKEAGHEITTVCSGMAMSFGAVLLQAGDKRIMGKNSFVLIHEAQMHIPETVNTTEALESVKFAKKLEMKILNIFEEKSKLSKMQIKRKWSNKEWVLDAEECLRVGLIDEIR